MTAWMFAIAAALVQDPAPPAAPPPIPIVMVSVPPIAPVDANTPYASPRDGARHRLQATLADLSANRHLKDGLRGFTQSFLEDHTYGAAAFDLGILAAISEMWDDAVAALEEASKLDPGLGKVAAPQLERLRMIARLEKSAEGRRRRAYDEALLPLLQRFAGMPANEANSALAELGRIDPKRWEAPALLAGLNGDGTSYQTASKFLDIAITNSSSPIRQALESAHRAAERELSYSSTRAAAEAASDQGDYPKSAELYQSAWSGIPARLENGMDAAAALLLSDDTQHACSLLARLRDSKDPEIGPLADAMLKELAAVETAASTAPSDAAKFFQDSGPREPVRIATMIPPIDPRPLELYTRPLPKLVDDPEPVVLLASLAFDAPPSVALPVLSAPSVAGEHPWREASQPSRVENSAPRAVQTADLSAGSPEARTLQVTSDPAGARLFVGTTTDPTCETPCNVRVAAAEYAVRVTLAGYREAQQAVQVKADVQDLAVPLEILRGSVILETATRESVKVNGSSVAVDALPIELSFAPGLYRVGADSGSGFRERTLMIKPGARLRLDVRR
jgi:hypothetical protein